jgi:hypothetical protein
MSKKEKKDAGWARQTQYVDLEGRRMTEFDLMDGSGKVYLGLIQIPVQIRNPNMPPQVKDIPIEFEFPKDKDFNWCMENFDRSAQTAIEQFKKDQDKAQAEAQEKRRKEIISNPNIGKIIDPKSGRPIK